jgi:beta-galactosidase
MTLGVCYYPDHWPRERWAQDAKQMKELGIERVRIGEFAWSLIEPEPGRYDFEWLDAAFDTLHAAGLGVILGTPTSTAPKWLVDQNPGMLPVGQDGRVRGFGSRKHYCHRNATYRQESERIVSALAERYGSHPALVAWQTDNEYGCHDTTRCWCDTCRHEFRTWLKDRYQTVDALNEAWWTVFWSQTYRSFDEVELPEQAVTETNPSHRLDFYRFASDGVVGYNRVQVDAIRKHSDLLITHNSMGLFPDYDHVDLVDDLDVIAWDNYPLGNLEESPFPNDIKEKYLRVGHPDLVSMSHDLYRGLKNLPHWIMEQQPGQVNWASNNPLPAEGAVRLWSFQALGQGAEMVSYFRWRSALGAQELMHAGLLKHDGTPDQAFKEAGQVNAERTAFDGVTVRERLQSAAAVQEDAAVAILVDYDDMWSSQIQPHAQGFNYWTAMFGLYEPLQEMGVRVDLVPKKRLTLDGDRGRSLDGYTLVLAPAMQITTEPLAKVLSDYVAGGGRLLLGARAGSKTESNIAHTQQPGYLAATIGAQVTRVDGLRPGVTRTVSANGETWTYATWADLIDVSGGARALATYDDPACQGSAAYAARSHGQGEFRMLGALLDLPSMRSLLKAWLDELGVETWDLHDGVRRHGPYLANYLGETQTALGHTLPPFGVVKLDRPS